MEEEKSVLNLFTEKNHGISRRFFLKTCGTALAIASMPINLTKVFAADIFTKQPVHTTMTWSLDPHKTQTLAWTTSLTAANGVLEYTNTADYKKNGWKNALTVSAVSEDFKTNSDYVKLHHATAEQLTPGTSYTYRVGTDNNWSQIASFSTEPAKISSFKFLVFGDSQSGIPANPEYGPWKKTIENAYAAHSDAAFFMNIGDLVEIGQDYNHWKNWYAAAKNVLEKIPAMAVAGNHETYTNHEESKSSLPVYFLSQMKLPMNGPAELKGHVYSFDYGNVHFCIMDSQKHEEGPYISDFLEKQAAWLDKDLATSNQPWKLIFFHKTPYYNKATRSNEDLKQVLLPVIDKHHADLVINGHDHGYSRTYPIYQDKFVDSPANGTIYLVTGRSGNKFYTDLSQKVWDAFFHDPQAEPNYAIITAAGMKLTIDGYTQSGHLIDSYTIDKARKTDSPRTILPSRSNYTRLSIWGNLLQTPLLSTPPKKIDNNWYIPLDSFIDFIGGDIEQQNKTTNITLGKDKFSFTADTATASHNGTKVSLAQPIKINKNTAMISAADLKTCFSFNSRFDNSLNILFVVK